MFNLIFLGERNIAYECLKVLHKEKYKIHFHLKGIVTNNSFFADFIKDMYVEDKIIFISNSKRNNGVILETINLEKINLLISVQHVWVLPKDIIDSVNGTAFNLHNAKLPDYKGFNSISHAIINNEKEYFSTIHWMVPEVDMGDIVVERKTDIIGRDTALSLYNKTIISSTKAFEMLLDYIIDDNIPRKSIETVGFFYKKKYLDKYKHIKLENSPEYNDRIIRGSFFPPHSPAYIFINDMKYFIVPEKEQYNDEN